MYFKLWSILTRGCIGVHIFMKNLQNINEICTKKQKLKFFAKFLFLNIILWIFLLKFPCAKKLRLVSLK